MAWMNPCITCGACCAHFRVSFYWAETDPARGGSVPEEWTEDVTGWIRCMRGTNQPHPHCAALEGSVGGLVRCRIYANRPSPCREFGIHVRAGKILASQSDLERCNRARAAYHLPPLDRARHDHSPSRKKHPLVLSAPRVRRRHNPHSPHLNP